jgi:type II secretory ATPase GspE/PulE/Tfp pilus assembly ATPase PilB-like protein
MSTSAAPEAPRNAATTLPPFPWPTPPYASYRDDTGGVNAWPCEVEGMSGQKRKCLLMALNPTHRVALIQVPPAQVNMPMRFAMFRSIAVKMPLRPSSQAVDEDGFALSELLDYRQRVRYRLTLQDNSVAEGETIGHIESPLGLFLFHPLDDSDVVERIFYPKESYQQVQLGDSIGQVLVEQHAVTPEQVERAAAEQESLRNRKLGDYLVIKEVVSPDQLMQALDQQSKMPMVRIGEALTALGLISDGQLKEALERQKNERTTPLGELLVKSGQLSRQDLQTALARKMGFPVVDVASFPIEAEALRKVPFAMAKRLKVLPLICREGVLIVAAEDPSKRATIDELEFTTQNKVVAALAGVSQLAQTMPTAYAKFGMDASKVLGGQGKADQDPELATADKLLESLELQSSASEHDNEPQIEQSDNSLVRLINTIIIDACNQRASDIHIETYPNKRKVRVRFRKDGHLAPYMELPHTYRSALVARIKIMCDLDISERRKPQDGKIEFGKFSSQYPIELRVATVPTQGGAEDVVMRLLASAKPMPLPELGITPENLAQLTHAVERPYGMVLCVGPTGSGKTTTLHAVLQHLNTPQRKIWTAEDPIEITNPDLRQVQVNPKIDWTFAKALRSFLRADPDIIMVGEIRDQETAQVSIEASLTGHLVLSTLHTNSAPETILRLLDMGMDPFNFSDSLLAVIAQRLVRQFCKECKRTEVADETYVDELVLDYQRAFPDDLKPSPESLKAGWLDRHGRQGKLLRCHAPGCSHCDNTGFKGRIGVHELMLNVPELRRLIQSHARPEELQHQAMRHSHFRTLRQDGIHKVLAGLTSIDEVRANCNA